MELRYHYNRYRIPHLWRAFIPMLQHETGNEYDDEKIDNRGETATMKYILPKLSHKKRIKMRKAAQKSPEPKKYPPAGSLGWMQGHYKKLTVLKNERKWEYI